MKKHILFLNFLFLLNFSSSFADTIGLCVMATGKYSQYAERMIASARTYFCNDHDVTFFVFTDQKINIDKDIVRVEQKRLGWPYDTLFRFKVYYDNKHLFKKMDYLFAVDADMLFVDHVGSEILSDRVATLHPGYVGKKGPYEKKRHTMARVKKHEEKNYYCGGFYGGRKKEFLRLCNYTTKNIKIDLKNDFIAVWHDESHINRFFIDRPPTKVLSPSYCYPESWDLPYPKKLLALDKDHLEMRK